jgi:hypothetical protein
VNEIHVFTDRNPIGTAGHTSLSSS